jgi:hypothetical protein
VKVKPNLKLLEEISLHLLTAIAVQNVQVVPLCFKSRLTFNDSGAYTRNASKSTNPFS